MELVESGVSMVIHNHDDITLAYISRPCEGVDFSLYTKFVHVITFENAHQSILIVAISSGNLARLALTTPDINSPRRGLGCEIFDLVLQMRD